MLTIIDRSESAAALTDLNKLVGEYISTWYPNGETWSDEDIDHLADLPGLCHQPSGAFLVACVDGLPAGCLMSRPRDADLDLIRLYVKAQFRGFGIAGQLVGEAITAAGNRLVFLSVQTVRSPAIRLYRSVGFVACSAQTIPGYVQMRLPPDAAHIL